MYRPSMYNKHDESMYAFVELFNNCKVCNDVIMKPNDEETYGNDGYFIHSNGQKSVMIGNIETDIFQIAGCSLIHWDNTKEN